MPIDADRFLAEIRGGSNGPSNVFDNARVPDRGEAMSPTNDVLRCEDELHSDSVLGAKLESATAKSLIKANEILDIPLDPERRHYQAELRARASIINTTLNTQVRVGEAALHKKTWDRLPEIIKLIQEEEERLYGPPRKTANELKHDADDGLRLDDVRQQMQDRKQDDG
jgi:hypothetical protein